MPDEGAEDVARQVVDWDWIAARSHGSGDNTLQELIREFSLVPFPEASQNALSTQPVRNVYHSRIHHNLKIIF